MKRGEYLKDIADDYNVTEERIRQIVRNAGVVDKGCTIRKELKWEKVLSELNEESKDLFYNSGCNKYDLLEECTEIYRVKKYYFNKTNLTFDVKFTDIIWNRFCPLSKEELDYFAERHSRLAPIITFMDWNKGGYVNGNVHTVARFMKSR